MFTSTLGTHNEGLKRQGLKSVFGALMRANSMDVASQLSNLVNRISLIPEASRLPLEQLLLRLNHQYPNDVGCFCVFLFNYMVLNPGEAIFLSANLPHAYISGGLSFFFFKKISSESSMKEFNHFLCRLRRVYGHKR